VNVFIADLKLGREYPLQVVAQIPAKNSGTLLKGIREVRSEFKLIAQH
jgi:hypothetical protein